MKSVRLYSVVLSGVVSLAFLAQADEAKDYASLVWICKSTSDLQISVNKIMRPDANDSSKPDLLVKYQLSLRKDLESEFVEYGAELTTATAKGKSKKDKQSGVKVTEVFTHPADPGKAADPKIIVTVKSVIQEGSQAKAISASLSIHGKNTVLTCE